MISGHRPQPSPLLVELVGPAGVGKTTLSRALVGRGGVATAAIWGLPAAALIGNGVRLLPSLLENCRRSGSLLWDESRHMVRLATLQRALTEAKPAAPQVMLFDEVTSALDPELTAEVLAVMEDLATRGMTMITVTHEMGFARKVANQVVFMHRGKIWESGPTSELFARPQTAEFKQFISSEL